MYFSKLCKGFPLCLRVSIKGSGFSYKQNVCCEFVFLIICSKCFYNVCVWCWLRLSLGLKAIIDIKFERKIDLMTIGIKAWLQCLWIPR